MDDAPSPPVLWRGDGADQVGIARRARRRTLAGHHVRVHGLGPVGVAAAEAAARGGADAVSLAGSREAPAAPVARLLARIAPGTRIHLDTARRVDGSIVAAYGSVAPALAHRLLLDGPHVAALADESGVSILPVRAGAGACLRCHALLRTDRDPAWPVLARQCEALTEQADPLTATVAGGLAVASLAALLENRPARPWRIEHGLPRRTAVPPHPACGCGAA
ncbi:hypothetical protein [Demequina phytophila]|uniref:hypothetical protein n=1 Tax=Demequina phytophila TaxID=1638981 RepID=UPI0007811E31|nr:hypothetical protein [Demequina phytophila]